MNWYMGVLDYCNSRMETRLVAVTLSELTGYLLQANRTLTHLCGGAHQCGEGRQKLSE